jgi:membrane protease YdiL (CAAX protease family)
MASRGRLRSDAARRSAGGPHEYNQRIRMAGQKKKSTKSKATSPLLDFTADSYLERTSRPLYAIVFLIPFIIFYELGTAFINTDVLSKSQVRVVAFVWLQNFLEYIGTSSRLAWAAPPVVVVVILVGLQVAARKPWYFCFGDYIFMAIECVLLAIPLVVLSLVFHNAPQIGPRPPAGPESSHLYVQVQTVAQSPPSWAQAKSDLLNQSTANGAGAGEHSLMASIVTGVGAGIYEELVFRLILICVLMFLFQDLFGLDHTSAIIVSVLLSAALFSAHHHIVFVDGRFTTGDSFGWGKFIFRTTAGVYFAVLYAIRGFGITAGTHALYDIIGTVVNAVFFDA